MARDRLTVLNRTGVFASGHRREQHNNESLWQSRHHIHLHFANSFGLVELRQHPESSQAFMIVEGSVLQSHGGVLRQACLAVRGSIGTAVKDSAYRFRRRYAIHRRYPLRDEAVLTRSRIHRHSRADGCATGLILASVGLYGVTAYSVERPGVELRSPGRHRPARPTGSSARTDQRAANRVNRYQIICTWWRTAVAGCPGARSRSIPSRTVPHS